MRISLLDDHRRPQEHLDTADTATRVLLVVADGGPQSTRVSLSCKFGSPRVFLTFHL